MFTPLKLDNAFVLVNNVGCVKIVPVDPSKSLTHVLLLASRTETWYVPAASAVNVFEGCQFVPSMLYSYVPKPPAAAFTVIEPFEFP